MKRFSSILGVLLLGGLAGVASAAAARDLAVWVLEIHRNVPAPDGILWIDNTNNGTALRVESFAGTALDSVGDATFTGGSVGIGTINPATPLHVNGQVTIEDGSHGDNRYLISDATGAAEWHLMTDVKQFEYFGNETGAITVSHDLGREPTLIEARVVEHENNGESGINWSVGHWQRQHATASIDQRTECHHGAANINYTGPIGHVANNPTANYTVNHYARLTVTNVTATTITFSRSKNGTELDGHLLQVSLTLW